MIDAGITGGEHIYAGELVRILINHPDVNIKWVSCGTKQGNVTDIHHGLDGECDLIFSEPVFGDVDVVFCCDATSLDLCKQAIEEFPELRIIDLTCHQAQGCMYGLCEVNRKFMVHDCYGIVTVPSALAMVSLLPLVPMAKAHNLPSGKIGINITCGERWLEDGVIKVVDEMESVLSTMQPGFDMSGVELTTSTTSCIRDIKAVISLDCQEDAQGIAKLCEDYYDDHNFTFIVNHEIDSSDVKNTNKCLISVENYCGGLKFTATIDGFLKGAAGNAVHIMNLLFGLHERVGLVLKAQVF